MPEALAPDVATPAENKGRILVIDDEADIRESLETLLELEGYAVDLAPDGGSGLKRLESAGYDLILLDLMMPDRSGMEVLREVRERDGETPIFMITAYGSVEVAVSAMKAGANYYFSKPWDNDKLLAEIDLVITRSRLERENTQLKRALKERYSFPNIIGRSDRMLRVLDLVTQVAPSRATILITGETGTGKELIAKAIHAHSARADQMFVAVNSGSVPPDLLESALFGHVKGAFTDARADRPGRFEIAEGGTLFLDEIANLTLGQQAKLLRVLQMGDYERVGSSKVRRADVRVLSATNADLRTEVREGRFREDLLFRINTVEIHLPPLRERREDIPLLASAFLKRHAERYRKPAQGFEAAAMQALLDHPWPGNIRELGHVIERAVLLSQSDTIRIGDLALRAPAMAGTRLEDLPLEDVEKILIRKALAKHGGNVSRAARALGLSRSALYRRLEYFRLGLHDPI